MACMEHSCFCGYVAFNNNAHSPSICPKCGDHLRHDWDEQPDYDRERERERDDEDREVE